MVVGFSDMHPERWSRERPAKPLSVELGRGEGTAEVGIPHPNQMEPQGPTKLTNEGAVPVVGCSMPSVSIECDEMFYPEEGPQELFEEMGMEQLVPESWDQMDIKIGNMNPFKAYIVSRQATGTGCEPNQQPSHQPLDLVEVTNRDSHNISPGFSSVRVLHAECCTARGTSMEDGNEGVLALQMNTHVSHISVRSDEYSGESSYGHEDGQNDSLAWTADTLPFELLDQCTPKSKLDMRGGDSSASKLCRDWDFQAPDQGQSSAIELHHTSLLNATHGNISILSSHDSISCEDTNLDITTTQMCPDGSRAHKVPSLGLASTYATSVPSIACPEGSEMEFSWLAKKPQQVGSLGGTTLSPMGSASVDEAWDDLFAGGTTAPGGSVKTCLTSWEYLFPKDRHSTDNGKGMIVPFGDGPSVRTSSICSTLAHTNLESTPREVEDDDGQSSQRWSVSDADLEVPPLQDDVHRRRSTDVFVNNQIVTNPPMHLLPANLRVQGNSHPAAAGEKIMNAFYTSQPRVLDKNSESLHQKESPSQKMESSPNGVLRMDYAPHRARFSVFLETGYPGTNQAADKRLPIVPTHMPRKKGAPPKKWKCLLSSFGQMFGCFKEERSLRESTRLEGISELALESSETSPRAGKYNAELKGNPRYVPNRAWIGEKQVTRYYHLNHHIGTRMHRRVR